MSAVSWAVSELGQFIGQNVTLGYTSVSWIRCEYVYEPYNATD